MRSSGRRVALSNLRVDIGDGISAEAWRRSCVNPITIVRGSAADMLPKRLVYSTNDANSVRHANALITFKLRFSLH